MAVRSRSSTGTRQRLLGAACEVFAREGYRGATVAEICDKAEANIAAVNYHFGSKENLYAKAWQRAFRRSLEIYPPDGGVGANAPPREQLRARIRMFVRRVLDEEQIGAFAIMCAEMAHPTGLLDEVRRQAIRPLRREMLALVRKLIGPGASDEQVELCGMSIINQCVGLRFRPPMRGANPARKWLSPQHVGELADHITDFSLAGIAAIRRGLPVTEGASR